MVKKLLLAVVALSLLLLPMTACGTKGTIKIGVVLSTTGLLGPMGQDMMLAARLAAKEINADGGVLGKQIELVEEDDNTDAAKCLERVKKMVEIDGVKVMVGGMTSGAAMASGPYLAEKSVLMVTPSATSTILEGQTWREWLFRTTPDDAFQGRVLADVVLENGFTRLATMVQDNPYGVGLEKALVDALEAKGWQGEQVVSIHFDPAKKDYRTELDTIKGNNPDVVLAVTYAEDGIIVFKQALEMGLDKIAWLGCDGNYGDGMFAEPKSAEFMEKAIIAGTRAAGPSGATYDKFAAAYKADTGKDPSVYCDTVYDAVKMIATAIKNAGTDDGAAVRSELMKLGKNYDGASGTITFDEGGDRVSGTFEIWKVVKDATTETGYKNVQIKLVNME
jgi:ABC-type branched-subunit amino acid transport system substrate-binding protein